MGERALAHDMKRKKISVSIDKNNFDKIQNILREDKNQTPSSVVNFGLSLSLEEVAELIKNPIELEKQILKMKLEDLEKIQKQKEVQKNEKKI